MYRLDAALSAALAAGQTVIVPSRQRAAAVRLAYAWQQREAGRSVWSTPDVIAWDAWLSRELARARQVRGAGSVLLNVSQQHLLWQQVLQSVAQPPERGEFLQAHAEAIASAARLVREWQLHWPDSGVHEEAALLSQALRAMDQACSERGVLLASLAREQDLVELAPAPVVFAGFAMLTPRQRQVARKFGVAGNGDVAAAGDAARGAIRAASYKNAASESAAIGAWCRERLAADATQRLLVICADPRTEPGVLHEAIARALDPLQIATGSPLVAVEGGAPLVRQPLVAAALALLQLGSADIEFTLLSIVLLSPFFALGEEGERVRLELWLRDRLPQRIGRAAVAIQLEAAPPSSSEVAGRLRAVLDAVAGCWGATRAGPRDWAMRFTDVLRAAGHPGGRPASSEETQGWQRWQSALEEFASLDAYSVPLGAESALGRLAALLERVQHQAATGDAAVTVTAWREDPIVSYDGVWVAGLGEAQCPEPPRPDAFVPLAVQRASGLPQVSSATRLLAARAQFAAWARRASGELVLSYPRAEGDLEVAPSLFLQGLPVTAHELARRPWLAAAQAERTPLENALPPIVAPGVLRAGAKLPELQRECPFRAQAELRLNAKGLAAPRIGIDPRLRGKLVHRAMELLWSAIGSSHTLRSRRAEAWKPEINAAVVAALAATDSSFGAPPSARELARESERCAALLQEALQLESRRTADFAIEAGERQVVWTVAGAQLKLRIDRIDRLADGSRVVIDYKTGAHALVDLLSAAARPVQLLAYLDALGTEPGADISALALLKLVPGKPEFRAAEDGRAGLPVPRSRAGPMPPWPEQLAIWRADVQGLVARHIAGDAQVQPLPRACEHCKLPALCRIDAQSLNATLDAGVTADGGDGDDVEGADE